MNTSTLKVILECSHCQKETLHEIKYINEILDRTVCTDCGNIIQKSESEILTLLLTELADRITSKPSRLHDEMKEDFWTFASKFSVRMVTKPYRFIKEITDMLDELKSHHQEE